MPLSADQRRRADELVTVFENSSLEPKYNFAADLGDGRGITFGRAGFTTGTGDGLWVVNRYVQAKPVNNTLAPFVPALARILAERMGNASAWTEEALLALAANVTAHEITGAVDWGAEEYGVPLNDTSGLGGFIEAVQALGGDPVFRQVQDSAMDSLFYNPSQRASAALGLRLPLSKAQLYDTWVQHGSADPQSPVFARSANGIISYVDKKLGGYPLQGVNETLWLETFLQRRRYVLSVTDDVWAASIPRVDLYKWLIEAGALQLDRPMRLLWERCRPVDPQVGYHPRGPCTNQTAGIISVGGVDYGSFDIP